jgi:Rrf2 family nitric oxide-sensitive transcriptional repressor
MHLTQFSDYGLRILLYLGVHPPGEDGSLPTLFDISQAYAISFNHLSKVAQQLTRLGLVIAQRGRTGGMRLARPPEEIRIGDVVRVTESNFKLVECFDPATNKCSITAACDLKDVLFEARDAFLRTLDRYTLADVLHKKPQLVQLWLGPAHTPR